MFESKSWRINPGPFHYLPETIRINSSKHFVYLQMWDSQISYPLYFIALQMSPYRGRKRPKFKENLGTVLPRPWLNLQGNTVKTPAQSVNTYLNFLTKVVFILQLICKLQTWHKVCFQTHRWTHYLAYRGCPVILNII